MKIRSLGILAAVASSALLGGTAAKANSISLSPGDTYTLQDILNAGGVATYGNLVFTFNALAFSSSVTGAPGFAEAPSAAQITVKALAGVPGEPGIYFSDDWFAANGATADTHIGFTVTTSNGALIDDDYLATTGSVVGIGNWGVSETVKNNAGATLGNFQINNLMLVSSVTATFSPQSSLVISKDIQLGAPGFSQISDVAQGFSTIAVPLPNAAMMGFGTLVPLAGLLFLRRRRQLV